MAGRPPLGGLAAQRGPRADAAAGVAQEWQAHQSPLVAGLLHLPDEPINVLLGQGLRSPQGALAALNRVGRELVAEALSPGPVAVRYAVRPGGD
jgi:hypothetical protein